MKRLAQLFAVALMTASVAQAQRQQSADPPVSPLPALSAEARTALNDLSAQAATEVQLQSGWFRDREVKYYNMGVTPQPVVVGRVLWPIHGFDMRGNPVAMRGQKPIFSSLPGLEGYSGVWRLTYVVVADKVQPNAVKDMASAEALVKRGLAVYSETAASYNLPIVPQGTKLVGDSTAAMSGWYEGHEVTFFDFGHVNAAPAPMLGFVTGEDDAGEPIFLRDQFSVVDTLNTAGPYADLWELQLVKTDADFVAGSIKSKSALARTSLQVDPTQTIRNGPIAMVDGSRVARKPSPLTAYADLRSPFPPAPTRAP